MSTADVFRALTGQYAPQLAPKGAPAKASAAPLTPSQSQPDQYSSARVGSGPGAGVLTDYALSVADSGGGLKQKLGA